MHWYEWKVQVAHGPGLSVTHTVKARSRREAVAKAQRLAGDKAAVISAVKVKVVA